MILPYRGTWPRIHETAFVASSVDIIGDVHLGAHSTIWYQCVVRGDVHSIRIGNNTNIQDLSVLHVTRNQSCLVIGDEVTIGHRVTLHGCKIGNRVLVGMGSIILDDAEIGDNCLIGAGTLITARTKIPPGSLVLGSPGKVVRPLNEKELEFLPKSASHYVDLGIEYRGTVPGPGRYGQSSVDLEFFPEDFRDLSRNTSSNSSGTAPEGDDL
ncbi:MAG: gamma carbonic anhydrase family protein [Bdellovibrio sp.]|nr:gamma carbonic anhydrase family protein [Bdellovibrio sp.]